MRKNWINCGVRNLLLASLLSAANFGVVAAEKAPARQAVVVEDSERERAVDVLAPSKKLDLATLDMRHADGVKGYKRFTVEEGPGVSTPERRTAALVRLACNASIFGLVTLDGAAPFVGKGDRGVFTKLRFRVIQDWRANPENHAPDVHLIVHAGELVHAGERVRVENPLANYELGASYILVAGVRSGPDHGKTIYQQPPFIAVEGSVILPPDGWDIFAAGTTVRQAQADVAQALAAKGCE